MERVIVTFALPQESSWRDLDIPTDITGEALAQEVASAFGLSGRYEVYADSVCRALFPQESLSHAGVWDGVVLTLRPLGTEAKKGRQPKGTGQQGTPPLPPESLPDSPVRGWRPLDIPTSEATDETCPPRSGGFTWKQIDDD